MAEHLSSLTYLSLQLGDEASCRPPGYKTWAAALLVAIAVNALLLVLANNRFTTTLRPTEAAVAPRLGVTLRRVTAASPPEPVSVEQPESSFAEPLTEPPFIEPALAEPALTKQQHHQEAKSRSQARAAPADRDTAETPRPNDAAPVPSATNSRPLRKLLSEPIYGTFDVPNYDAPAEQGPSFEEGSRFKKVFDPRLRGKLKASAGARSATPAGVHELNNSTMADAQQLLSHGNKCFRVENDPTGGSERVLYIKKCLGEETESAKMAKGLREAMERRALP